MSTIIIGAGASGLAAAISLKQRLASEKVIILERLSSAGKKILATGNGRCNLTNRYADGYDEVKAFFKNIGLMLCEEEQGRIYPYSLKAETVLDILLEACHNLNIEIITDCEVTEIKKDLTVHSSKGVFKADNIIVAAGGKAQKNLGSDGSGYTLLKKLGHSTTDLTPALVQLTSSSKYPRAIKGTRTRCNLKIELDGRIEGNEHGEILFTDYGLSGIAAMNLSCIVSENFAKKNPNTNGGIPLYEIHDYQSTKIKNLYICGEILDKQFPCGGFNLDFAWQSGIKTANRIVEKKNDTN